MVGFRRGYFNFNFPFTHCAGPEGISAKDLVQRTRFLKSRVYRKALLDDLFESELINKEFRPIGVSKKTSLVWFCE